MGILQEVYNSNTKFVEALSNGLTKKLNNLSVAELCKVSTIEVPYTVASHYGVVKAVPFAATQTDNNSFIAYYFDQTVMAGDIVLVIITDSDFRQGLINDKLLIKPDFSDTHAKSNAVIVPLK